MTNDKSRPSMTVEGQENKLISLAVNLAEKQLREGTASSQIITHYLELGADREKRKLENELLAARTELERTKIVALAAEAKTEEMYANAIEAMKRYSGNLEEDEMNE